MQKYKEIKEGLSIWTILHESPASNYVKSKFNKTMVNRGYGLYDHIKFKDYIIVAKKNDCFIKWLLKEGFIKEIKKNDKWNPNTGNWIRVDWKDIGSFKPGVMLNRVWEEIDSVTEITKKVYWRDHCSEDLLAIKARFRSTYNTSGYSERGYYLTDLFNGEVFMLVEQQNE